MLHQCTSTSEATIGPNNSSNPVVGKEARTKPETTAQFKTNESTTARRRPLCEDSWPGIRKRIGTITVVFVTLLLGPINKKRKKNRKTSRAIERRALATAQSEEDVKSTANVVVVGQAKTVATNGGGGGGAASIRTSSCSSSTSPSPSKRKFQFQNNRTSPYEPQEARHVQYLQKAEQRQQQQGNAGDPVDYLTVVGGGSAIRPVELLHRRKIYVEGPSQLVGSSSSELSTPVTADANYRNRERQNYCDTPSVVVVGQLQAKSLRQISPASGNSESVATSNSGAGGGAGGEGESGIVPVAKNHRMSKFNSSMDRSVDSIGSCSLDVDADSTDFSDTSGSFNLLTPSSAKDFPREFITRIHERCQIQPVPGVFTHQNNQLIRQQLQQQQQQQQQQTLSQQQTTIVLDPQSGKVNTVLAAQEVAFSCGAGDSSEEPKKPSYLNLACCVNGYSNLTTYDSKFRQNISKSREVSPIRPATTTTTSQPTTVTTASGHLGVPHYSYYPTGTTATTTTSQPVSSNGNGFVMDHMQQQQPQPRSVMSPEKRLFTAHIMQSATLNSATTAKANGSSNGNDITDNVGMNGGDGLFRTTKYLYTKSEVTKNGNGTTVTTEVSAATAGNGSPCKSFIEQRVERLYGPGALAQGFHANRRSMEKGVLAERNIYSNTPTRNSPIKSMNGNGLYTPKRVVEQQSPRNGQKQDQNEQLVEDEEEEQTIPVLRHLRPEFRAQLPPISSPKRSPPPKDAATTNGGGCVKNGSVDVDAEVLVSQPMALQFQTVSISKLQSSTKTVVLTNGSSAKNVAAHQVNSTTHGQSGEEIVVATATTAFVKAPTTTTTTTSNAETIDNNNRGADLVGGGGGGGCHTIQISSNIGRNQNETNGGNSDREQPVELEGLQAERATVEIKMPTKQEISVPADDKENAMVKGGGGGVCGKVVEKADGNYFLGVMNGERNRILALADHCDTYIEEAEAKEEAEELVGIIRAASGKARLLSSQKMNQFQGLCHNQLHQAADEKFPTTAQDLQGFWDMLMLQVNHVDQLFEEIEKLKRNNWELSPDRTDSLPAPQGAKLVKRPGAKTARSTTSSSATTAASTAAAQKREAARKQLMELKRKNKLAMSAAGGDSAVVE